MEYNSSYHAHCDLTLSSGRSVRLLYLSQSFTYGGWQEGVPDSRINDQIVESAARRAKEKYQREPVLLKPRRRDYLRSPEHRDPDTEWLPVIESLCVLRSLSPARDLECDYSSVTVVWYQDEFGLPTGDFLEQFKQIDWERYAEDGDY